MPLLFHYETWSCLYIRICFSKRSCLGEEKQLVSSYKSHFDKGVDKRRTDGGRRTADGGRRTADGGRRTTDDGRRTADGGRRTAEHFINTW